MNSSATAQLSQSARVEETRSIPAKTQTDLACDGGGDELAHSLAHGDETRDVRVVVRVGLAGLEIQGHLAEQKHATGNAGQQSSSHAMQTRNGSIARSTQRTRKQQTSKHETAAFSEHASAAPKPPTAAAEKRTEPTAPLVPKLEPLTVSSAPPLVPPDTGVMVSIKGAPSAEQTTRSK